MLGLWNRVKLPFLASIDLIRSGFITDIKGNSACIYMPSVKGFEQVHTQGGTSEPPYLRTPDITVCKYTAHAQAQRLHAYMQYIFCMLMYCNSRTKKS